MPIRESERARYPKDWRAISRRIRERDGHRCKWCGVDNYSMVKRGDRFIRVVLTVAHLDHTPENCADENLVALCQRCHLTYDAKHHAANARATRDRRRGQGRLFS